MTIGIVGRKRGMTRVFTEDGDSVSVTVVEAAPNLVAGLMTSEANGYDALQVAWGKKKPSALTKSMAGNFAKANLEAAEGLLEYRIDAAEAEQYPAGTEIKVDMFEAGQKVDVTGTTIGKGFAGAIKRHHFAGQRNSHGNSLSHRAPGSIGQCQTPGRVFKGKKMAGQMGNKQRTIQNLEVVRVDSERNLLLIKGSVPTSKGGKVVVKPSIKQRNKA
ncbi:MAG: 50S ribosomal protein L3 [Gammaproteobacteria bacterium]